MPSTTQVRTTKYCSERYRSTTVKYSWISILKISSLKYQAIKYPIIKYLRLSFEPLLLSSTLSQVSIASSRMKNKYQSRNVSCVNASVKSGVSLLMISPLRSLERDDFVEPEEQTKVSPWPELQRSAFSSSSHVMVEKVPVSGEQIMDRIRYKMA